LQHKTSRPRPAKRTGGSPLSGGCRPARAGRKRQLVRWALALGMGFLLLIAGGSVQAAAPSPLPVVALREDGLTLTWRAADPAPRQRADGTIEMRLPGFDVLQQPGAPALPVASVLIALPPDAQPTLTVARARERTLPLPGPLAVAPQPGGVLRNPAGEVIAGSLAPAPRDASFAPDVVEIQPLGVVRGVLLARVVFYPLRLAGDGLVLTREIQLTLRYNAPLTGAAPPPGRDPILDQLRRQVINPEHLRPAAPPAATTAAARQTQPPTAVIEVTQTGLTALTYQDLAAAGFPVDQANPHNLQLTQAAAPVAVEWDGDADTSFEPGERILFFANPRFSRWSATDTYLLSEGTTPGLRMSTRGASPDGLPPGSATLTQLLEENRIYTPNCYCGVLPFDRNGDRWAWEEIRLPDQASKSFVFPLPTPDTAQTASLTLWLLGYTNVSAAPDHRVEVALNGVALGAVEWDGRQLVESTFNVPASALQTGDNTLTLTLPGLPGVAVEGMWLDGFSLAYAYGGQPAGESLLFRGESSARAYTLTLASSNGLRGYDVTDPANPVILSGMQASGSSLTLGDGAAAGPRDYALVTENGILSPAAVRMTADLQTAGVGGADYLIITHPDFAAALSPLIALRQSQGLEVAVEDVQAIYDRFGDGRPDPQAIYDFLAAAYDTWNPRPTYVLLVGDGTNDPKRYQDSSFETFIPPFLADVDPWIGETAADNRYATLDGDDELPDVAIGRLPVNSLAEAQTVIGKIVDYETFPSFNAWNTTVALVADDTDAAGDFAALLDGVAAAFIPPAYPVDRLYYLSGTPVEAFRDQVRSRINQGAGVLMYAGHASIHQWAAENFLHLDDVATLTNAARLPVALQLTCLTGRFQEAGLDTLDETLLRYPNGGVVAAWGATGLGVATGQDELARGFIQSVYATPGSPIGLAALAGKVRLANNEPAWMDLVETFTILGDPATQLKLEVSVPAGVIYLPSVSYGP